MQSVIHFRQHFPLAGFRLIALLLLAWLPAVTVRAQIPAFPGAEGFGAYATGGRGGDVYTVVNLNSSGEGSLRYGVETAPASGRTIVFAVSGYIPISYNADTGNQTVRIVQNKVTIAGQTAPGDGIGLKDGRILVTGNNVVLRHLRIRHGKYGGAGDCLNLESTADNSIIDHVSLMFSTDENISFFNSTLDNFTMQYCTSSWGMERHNAGGLWDLQDGTCHHSLWAHHRTRNPKARPYGLLEWINNVTYHWRTEGFIMGDSESNVDWYANVRGCYFLSIDDFEFGLENKALSKARIAANLQPNFHLYLDNCLHDADGDGLLNGTDQGYGIVDGLPYDPLEGAPNGTVRYDQSAVPFAGASGTATVNLDNPLTAYKKVISSAGALRLDATAIAPLRDELDTLLINSVVNQQSILLAKDSPLTTNDPPSNGEAQLAGSPYNISNGGFGTLNSASAPADSDLDGMPDVWENTLGWNVASQDHNTALSSFGGFVSGLTFFPSNTPAGYTRLEEYLHFKAIPHATIPRNTTGSPTSLTVDLRRYASGFNKAPVTFAFSNVTNGAVVLQPDGYTAVFTPALNYSGRARFDFKVTDGDGSTWTQTLGMLVNSAGAARDLKWKGDGSVNQWNTSTLNFLDDTNAVTFASGDNVRFDDTGSNTPSINLTTAVSPSNLVVNAAINYTFGGAGSLSGSGALTKSGSGTLTISTTNTSYSGNVSLTNGTITLGIGGSTLTTGNLTLGGGATFNLPPTTPAYFYAGNITVLANQSGTIYSPGLANGLNGPLLAGNTNSVLYLFSGVSFGGINASQFNGFGGIINIPAGATLRFSANSSGNLYGSLNPAFVINGSLRPRNAGNSIQLGAISGTGSIEGPQSNAGSGNTTYLLGGNNLDATFNGTISSNNTVPGTVVTLVKTGSGKLTLVGSSTFTGGTTVSNGTLLVNNPTGSGSGMGAVLVKSGATLGGTGVIGGPAKLEASAKLAPGNGGIGTLTFSNSLTLGAGCTTIVEIARSPLTNDVAKIFGVLTNGGALIITNLSPGALTAGDTFKLFDAATYAGNFSAIVLPTLSASLVWNTNSLATAGMLSVFAVPPPVIGNAVLRGGKLVLTGNGGPPGANCFVIAATNLATPVTNWIRVQTNQFDASGNFSATNTPAINAQNFYRLQLQ